MDREKQIEEMCEIIASMICEVYNPLCDENKPHTCSRCYANSTKIGDFAEMLYNAGYRKQSEGEWKTSSEKFSNIYDHFYCSNCGNYTEERNPYKLGKYCSYCGSKMKGGEQE